MASLGQAHDTLLQYLPVNLPNGNVVMLPSDLYFFFETEEVAVEELISSPLRRRRRGRRRRVLSLSLSYAKGGD